MGYHKTHSEQLRLTPISLHHMDLSSEEMVELELPFILQSADFVALHVHRGMEKNEDNQRRFLDKDFERVDVFYFGLYLSLFPPA